MDARGAQQTPTKWATYVGDIGACYRGYLGMFRGLAILTEYPGKGPKWPNIEYLWLL